MRFNEQLEKAREIINENLSEVVEKAQLLTEVTKKTDLPLEEKAKLIAFFDAIKKYVEVSKQITNESIDVMERFSENKLTKEDGERIRKEIEDLADRLILEHSILIKMAEDTLEIIDKRFGLGITAITTMNLISMDFTNTMTNALTTILLLERCVEKNCRDKKLAQEVNMRIEQAKAEILTENRGWDSEKPH